MNEDFWSQFWPQFWGGVAATVFLAVLAFVFTYVARLQIARFLRRFIVNMKRKIALEEEKIKAEYISKK
jgi:ABC-type Fe3+ transport system permease subunit